MEEGFIILCNTLCQGDIPAYKDEKGRPIVYKTIEEAYKEMADSKIMELQQFIDGKRGLEETSFEFEDWPAEVWIEEDGVIYGEYEEIYYDPTQEQIK